MAAANMKLVRAFRMMLWRTLAAWSLYFEYKIDHFGSLVFAKIDGFFPILWSVDGETDRRDSLLTNSMQTSWSVDGETDCRDSLLTNSKYTKYWGVSVKSPSYIIAHLELSLKHNCPAANHIVQS